MKILKTIVFGMATSVIALCLLCGSLIIMATFLYGFDFSLRIFSKMLLTDLIAQIIIFAFFCVGSILFFLIHLRSQSKWEIDGAT